jgi:hypothetical protein
MSGVAHATGPAGASRWEIRRGIFRGFGARHLNLAIAFAVAYNVLGHLGFPDFDPSSFEARMKLFIAIPGYLMLAAFALLVTVAIENAWTRPPLLRLRYPLAVLLAAAGAVLLSTLIGLLAGTAAPLLAEHQAPQATVSVGKAVAAAIAGTWIVPAVVAHYLKAGYICALIISLHAIFEANRRATAHLHAVQMQALDADHELFADELRAIQTRVDPDLLFDALRDIDAAYGTDPAAGQAHLDALIRFLRAALPGDLTANSTIADERELVEAYVALISFQRPSPPRLDFVVDSALLAERLPPLILLPLVRWALAGAATDRLRLKVVRRDEALPASCASLDIIIEAPAGPAPARAEEELTTLRARLQRFYGAGASCRETSNPRQRQLLVSLPLDSARVTGASAA